MSSEEFSAVRMTGLSPILLTLPLAACSWTLDSDEAACMADVLEPVAVAPEGATTDWVIDSIQLPDTATAANQLAHNLDCDAQGRPDNAIGQILSTLASQSVGDLNAELAAMMAQGRLLHLVTLQATGLVDAEGVGFTLRHGLDTDADPSDNFSGSESFAVDTDRGSGTISGTLTGGRLVARGGQLPVGLLLPSLDEAVILPFEASVVVATIEGDRMEGRIGGGVPEAAKDAILVPFFLRGFMAAVERDCPDRVIGTPPCPCAEDSFGQSVLAWFDEQPDRPGVLLDGDCDVTLPEFSGNSLVTSLGAVDVDLFDGDGNLHPREDGAKDSLSVGLGFTAVPARLTEDVPGLAPPGANGF